MFMHGIEYMYEQAPPRIAGVLKALQVGQSHARHVDLVVLVHQHGVATAEDKLYLVEEGRAQVIVLVAGEEQHLTHVIAIQLEGTGAVGFEEPFLGITFYVLAVQDEPRRAFKGRGRRRCDDELFELEP